MYNWYELIRPMEMQDAVNFLGATQKQYNKNTGEGLSLQETFEMIEECVSNVGTNKDHAMLKTINDKIDGKSAKAKKRFFEELAQKVDTKAVNKLLKDEDLFEETDEYQMTEEEADEYYGNECESY